MATFLAEITTAAGERGTPFNPGTAGVVKVSAAGTPSIDTTLAALATQVATPPQVPAIGVVTVQDVVTALVTLGLITQHA